VGLSSLNPILFLSSKPGLFTAWASHFQCRLSAWCILAQFTKSWWHCITTAPCTIPCAQWLHRIISISTQVHLSLEQGCRYPIPPPPLERVLDNLITVGCFCCSLLEGYTFESWIALVQPCNRLELFGPHCKFFGSFGSSKGTWLHHTLSLVLLGQLLSW
jgi:hypothetical protein